MDFSQYIRLKNEAANVYLSRTKTVDSSLLTFKRQVRATHAGYNASDKIAYDISSCPIYTVNKGGINAGKGYVSVDKQSPHQNLILRAAGCSECHETDYSTASPGIEIQNYSTCVATLNQYNLSPGDTLPKPYGYGLKPGVCKPYGYGQRTFFPNPDTHTNDVYPPAFWPYK
jgi:hypothetical protein